MAPRERSSAQSRKPAANKKPAAAKKAAPKKADQPAPATGTAAAAHVPAPAPEALGPAGLKVWNSVTTDYQLRPDELRILEDACREATLIDRINQELQESPLIAKGSMGQPVASPLVQEIRQHRAVFAQLMARLKLADEDGETPGGGDRSAQARRAANARWRRG